MNKKLNISFPLLRFFLLQTFDISLDVLLVQMVFYYKHNKIK